MARRGGGSRKQAAPPKPIKTPQGSISTPPSVKKSQKSEWMQDFIVTHHSQAQSPPETRLTNLKSVAATVQSSAPPQTTKPGWMNDFDTSSPALKTVDKAKESPLNELSAKRVASKKNCRAKESPAKPSTQAVRNQAGLDERFRVINFYSVLSTIFGCLFEFSSSHTLRW